MELTEVELEEEAAVESEEQSEESPGGVRVGVLTTGTFTFGLGKRVRVGVMRGVRVGVMKSEESPLRLGRRVRVGEMKQLAEAGAGSSSSLESGKPNYVGLLNS